MKLESGPAAYDRNYYLVFFILCVGLGGYFYYDYTIGYLEKNREEARKQLTPLLGGADKVPEQFSPKPTRPEFMALMKSNPASPQDVHDELGAPLAVRRADDGKVIEYYVSDYGKGQVTVTNGRLDPTGFGWTTWYKTKDEIKLQLYCAIICFAVGLYVLTRVVRAATLRAVIDDEGMTYGRRRIPFEGMTRLCDYSKKGWVDLYYNLGSDERKLRIDNQKIRKFDEIIDALCKAKGFDDPRKVAEAAEKSDD